MYMIIICMKWFGLSLQEEGHNQSYCEIRYYTVVYLELYNHCCAIVKERSV